MTPRLIENAADLVATLNGRIVVVADQCDAAGGSAGDDFTHYLAEIRGSGESVLVERILWEEGEAAGFIRLVARLVQ